MTLPRTRSADSASQGRPRRTGWALAAVSTTVVLATALGGGTADAASGNTTGPIQNVRTKMCLDVLGGSASNYTPVQVYTCNSTAAQRWTVVPADRTVRAFGKCLDVEGGGTVDKTLIDLYQCNGTGAQIWLPEDKGRYYNPQSNMCLTNGSDIPAQSEIYVCDSIYMYDNQNWLQLPG